MSLNCQHCGELSGNDVLCRLCRKQFRHFSDNEKKSIMKTWKNHVIKKSFNLKNGKYKCEVCKHLGMSFEEAIGHHLRSKGSRPDLKFNILNGLCVDMACHLKIHSGNISLPL